MQSLIPLSLYRRFKYWLRDPRKNQLGLRLEDYLAAFSENYQTYGREEPLSTKVTIKYDETHGRYHLYEDVNQRGWVFLESLGYEIALSPRAAEELGLVEKGYAEKTRARLAEMGWVAPEDFELPV